MECFLYLFGHLLLLCLFYLTNGEFIRTPEDNLKTLYYKTAASEFSQHEVVRPTIYFKDGKQFQPKKSMADHPSEVNIVIGTSRGPITLVLSRNKNLFSKRYIEKSVTGHKKYSLKRPHFKKLQNHCYYHGHVHGAPQSIVAVSTCHGVSGYIQYDRYVYHIEPAFDLDQESHRLYNDMHSVNKRKHSNCGHQDVPTVKQNVTLEMEHKHDVFRRMKRSLPYNHNKNTRFVEMYIVNDFRTYESNNRDLDSQIRKTKNIINIVSRLYQPFSVYIALVGIENWTKQNMFSITTEADSTLENFLHYRRSVINPKHPNDNAQLITDTTFKNGVVGKAIKGTICTFKYSGGVNLNLATPGQTATTIAHELGHNFGMNHDNYTVCQCKEEKCIMAATSGGINTPTQWSSCSMLALQEAFEMGMDYCLRNEPEKLYDGPVCGNGFTEEGEECDCGMSGACDSKCCNASTCRLTPGSKCAAGKCCDLNTCKLKEAATLCRDSKSECDLPEYCWGDDPQCPADVYLQDGTDCAGGQSYCFNGTCKTHTGQCKLLWGSTGRVSDPVCFKHLNTNGSRRGNCGYNWTSSIYQPCLSDDVMCGLLHCVHQNEKLMFWKDNLAHATPATFLTVGPTTYVCRGAILDVGLDMPDPGMVPDGAKCGDRKVCYQHKCMDLGRMRLASCPGGCSDRGVCNTRGHCHCDEGWGGSDCDTAGNGGSIDSGPVKMNNNNGLITALVVVILIILLFVVGGILLYRFKDTLLAWWNKKVQKKHVEEQSQPLRPVHPPPKRNSPTKAPVPDKPPPYNMAVANQPIVKNKPKSTAKPVASNRNPGLTVKISGPVLTGSTHQDSKSQVKASPVPNHKPPPPKLPQKPTQPPKYPPESKPVNKKTDIGKPVNVKSEISVSNTKSKTEPDVDSGNDGKSRFGDLFKMPTKMPSFSKGDKKVPKVEVSKAGDDTPPPVVDIVKKRELTRNISNPVLISTTDRRSKHLVNLNTTAAEERDLSPPPPVPPHVSLNKNEYENIRKNRPLPPRPLSMPESECGDEPEVERPAARKSVMLSSSNSPRMPERPPPPPVKPNVDNTRKMLEDELAKLDSINVEIPRDVSPEKQSVVPLLPSNTKPKEIKPKPRANVTKSADANKKPLIPKSAASKTNSDTNKPIPKKPEIQRPLFNSKARPGLSSNDSKGSKSSNSQGGARSKGLQPLEPSRKPSTESIEDDQDEPSVAGLAKRFEAQKKPLLTDRSVKRTQSAAKTPMTPPKPRSGVKQIRSVDV